MTYLIRLFYAAATLAMKIALLMLADWQVVGAENVPRSGPLVVVANHQNLIDPPLISASLPRRVSFMAKQELFKVPVLGAFIFLYGSILVRRGDVDRKAIRAARRVLSSGGVLGMFPEGHRSATAELQPARAGAAYIASGAGVPLLPIGITGTNVVKGISWVLRRPRIRVVIGQTFSLPQKEGRPTSRDLMAMTDEIMLRIAALLPEDVHGAYRGRSVDSSQTVKDRI